MSNSKYISALYFTITSLKITYNDRSCSFRQSITKILFAIFFSFTKFFLIRGAHFFKIIFKNLG